MIHNWECMVSFILNNVWVLVVSWIQRRNKCVVWFFCLHSSFKTDLTVWLCVALDLWSSSPISLGAGIIGLCQQAWPWCSVYHENGCSLWDFVPKHCKPLYWLCCLFLDYAEIVLKHIWLMCCYLANGILIGFFFFPEQSPWNISSREQLWLCPNKLVICPNAAMLSA